ncbi:9767_t:CDS:2 [Diversispora eburnea]|uniref:9767_t:CDS:1 n=1 Tax=Diversispora eburnea TaxID=1213867 RepID=A0A9N8W544_9GLOM|nr:9767_t:CDS:2 [Diversispora eburnea]
MSQKNPRSQRSTIVIKLGTSSICEEETNLPLLSNLSLMVETVIKLRGLGHRVVLVTSGAIGALAAVGQGRLMRMYDDLFSQLNQPIAQILLTRHDLADRTQYLNAVNTFSELLAMGVVPIVNENDTVSEIKFGDNDTLSAITAKMVNADYLFLMTDVDCLYTDNPRTNPNAKPIEVVEDIGALKNQVIVSSPGSLLGTGGMVTKLIAADLATAAGITTIICLDRKWWILHGLHTAGIIYIDEGAVRAITKVRQKSSLFAAGIIKVEGNFVAQQAVEIVFEKIKKESDNDNIENRVELISVGKGLVNYSSTEISRIKGCKSLDIEKILGYADSECVIHRDNLAITFENNL